MNKKVIKRAGAAVLSYVVIYVIAVVLAVIRISLKADSAEKISFYEIMQVVIIPALFYIAGYYVTESFELPKMNAKTVWIASAVFAAVLLGIWYLSLETSALLNLPVAQGCYALDHWLRKINIVYEYEYTTLAKTDMYRYATLPLLYFAADILCWLCYFWGNRVCVGNRGMEGKKRKTGREKQ